MSKNRWTSEDYAAYVKAGSPEGWEPPRRLHPEGKEPWLDPDKPPKWVTGRTEKRAGGRIPRTIVDATAEVGCKFDSKAEARRYDWLMAQPDVVHVDVHPIFTLPGGIRYCGDFTVYRRIYHLFTGNRTSTDPQAFSLEATVEDVKGQEPSTAFRRIRRLFDAHHPLAPMRVVVWRKGEWQEI